MNDQNPQTAEVTEAVVEVDVVEVSPQNNQKPRNYSFLDKPEENLDAIEVDEGGETFVIPAQPGSVYWAIIKIGYEFANQPIGLEAYIDKVAELLEDRDPDKWDRYKNKQTVTTVNKGERVVKDVNSWRSRIETNIRTLTRVGGKNAYGQRLVERGHILRWEPDHFDGEGAFVLRTTTNKPLENRKRRSGNKTKG